MYFIHKKYKIFLTLPPRMSFYFLEGSNTSAENPCANVTKMLQEKRRI